MEIRSKVRMLLYENNSVVNEPQPANKATDVHAAKPSANNIFVFLLERLFFVCFVHFIYLSIIFIICFLVLALHTNLLGK